VSNNIRDLLNKLEKILSKKDVNEGKLSKLLDEEDIMNDVVRLKRISYTFRNK